MRKKLFKQIGILAIALGLFECILYLFNHFFIDHFSSLGFKEWISSFGLSMLLILSGGFLLKDNEIGIGLLKGYFWGTLLDRLLIFVLYVDSIHIFTIAMPLMLALPFGLILYFPRNASYFKHSFSFEEKLALSVLILALILIPKVA